MWPLLREHCKVNTNAKDDRFVGIKINNGNCVVHFPLGFNLSDDEDKLRKEILLLLNVLSKFNNSQDALASNIQSKDIENNIPLSSYLFLIYDFVQRGYYKECIVEYTSSKRGKINWSRTIKKKRPLIVDDDFIYLDFITKKNVVNENDMITMIHQYCVYRSFWLIGWLFTSFKPARPSIPFNRAWFRSILAKKLANTFNDQNKQLFRHMLKIVNEDKDDGLEATDFTFGTYTFEHAWENMIDSIFGIPNKIDYYPRTTWRIVDQEPYEMKPLRPDTIMLHNNNTCVYVLDAKYYKYGYTKILGDLPNSADINKQITYAEYIAESEHFQQIHGPNMKVYNAFVMPFNAEEWKTANKHYIGDAESSWKHGNHEYEKVKGILLDVKHVMQIAGERNKHEIEEMAELILAHCKENGSSDEGTTT